VSELRVNNVSEVGGDAVIASGVLDSGSLPAGSVLQVVSTTKTDTFTASIASGATATVSGLSATITPSSTLSKILVLINVGLTTGQNTTVGAQFILERNGSPVGVGDAAGNRTQTTNFSGGAGGGNANSGAANFLDSPASTSALTYSVDVKHNATTSETVYLNRAEVDSDLARLSRTISTITLMEVAG